MVTYDFTPFYRSTIGFDRMARFLENSTRVADVDNSYPPYNIEAIGDEHYRVTLAVAGFSRDELDLQVREDTLHVAGERRMKRSSPISASGDRRPFIQEAIPSGGSCQGGECVAGQRPPNDRSGARTPGGNETPEHRHRDERAEEDRLQSKEAAHRRQ